VVARVLERVIDPVSHLIPDHPADANPAGIGQGFQPRRDVDPVAEDVVALGDHVAEVDPDPELDALLGRDARAALGHPPLHLHGTPDGIDHAGELGQEPIAGVLHHAPAMFPDLGLDQLPKVRPQPFVRPLLIRPHQARVPRHVGGEDRGEAADGHDLSGDEGALTNSTSKPAATLASR
jgi:hypothetical protein